MSASGTSAISATSNPAPVPIPIGIRGSSIAKAAMTTIPSATNIRPMEAASTAIPNVSFTFDNPSAAGMNEAIDPTSTASAAIPIDLPSPPIAVVNPAAIPIAATEATTVPTR